MTSSPDIVVSAMYLFVTLDDYAQLREPLLELMHDNEIKGTLLLAREGINGTVAGPRCGIDRLLSWLKQDPRLAKLSHKESFDVAVQCRQHEIGVHFPGLRADGWTVVGQCRNAENRRQECER